MEIDENNWGLVAEKPNGIEESEKQLDEWERRSPTEVEIDENNWGISCEKAQWNRRKQETIGLVGEKKPNGSGNR